MALPGLRSAHQTEERTYDNLTGRDRSMAVTKRNDGADYCVTHPARRSAGQRTDKIYRDLCYGHREPIPDGGTGINPMAKG